MTGNTLATADDWPQWLGPQRDGIWRESGILETFPATGLKVLWRTPIGAGYSGPAISGGRVYITDRVIATGASNPSNAFDRSTVPGSERIFCLDEKTGEVLWKHEYDCPYTVSYPAGPRTTPIVDEGRVYTLGTEGHLYCLSAKNGKVIWSRELRKDYGIPTPLWGFSGHPLLDGKKLICLVGGTGTTAVAFDKETGRELWRALSAKEPGYAPPTMIQHNGTRQLIVWHPESINALDPKTGKVLWSHAWAIRMGLAVSTPRQVGDRLFFTAFYNGSKMLQLNADNTPPTVVWETAKISERDTTHLHSIMSTPFLEDGYIYGVCSYGQLRCLRADTGERVWETLKATTPNEKEVRWGNAFLNKHRDRFFLFNEKGDFIIAKLSPQGYEEIGRVHLLEPSNTAAGREVVWTTPAFANKSVFLRNDKEMIRVSLEAARP